MKQDSSTILLSLILGLGACGQIRTQSNAKEPAGTEILASNIERYVLIDPSYSCVNRAGEEIHGVAATLVPYDDGSFGLTQGCADVITSVPGTDVTPLSSSWVRFGDQVFMGFAKVTGAAQLIAKSFVMSLPPVECTNGGEADVSEAISIQEVTNSTLKVSVGRRPQGGCLPRAIGPNFEIHPIEDFLISTDASQVMFENSVWSAPE